MVHTAFDAVQIIKDSLVKIESVALWGSRLLVGCIDGSLRTYAPGDPPALDSSAEATAPVYILKETRVGFGKKALTALDVLQSRSLLISLSDAVAIHTLPEFDVVAQLIKTKGALLYAWEEERGLLCVARGKKLNLYQYDGKREFTEVKELTASAHVESMAWCAESLCLGINRGLLLNSDYMIMNIDTGDSVEVFPCGRHATPLVVPRPNGTLLLGKDKIGVFVDSKGKLIHPEEGNLSWSEAPGGVVVHPPYALARLSRFIEVRSLRSPYRLVQTLPLQDILILVATEAGLVACTGTSVYRLLPVAISVQVVQLAASGSFEDALALCELLPQEDAALRASKENALHKRFGEYLFEQRLYAEAMDHFAASSIDLTALLSLFPSIKLPNEVMRQEAPTPAESEQSPLEQSLTSDQAENSIADEASSMQSITPQVVDLSDPRQNKIALSALVTYLMKKRGAVIERAEAEDRDAAVAAIVEEAEAPRTRKLKASEKHAEPREEKIGEGPHDAQKLAIALDTALVQALLAIDQSAIALQLLKGTNFCDVGACEDEMLAGGHYLELLELYRSKRKHRQALFLLNRLAEYPETFAVPPTHPEQFDSRAIVNYLQGLGEEEHPLVMETSTWVLKNNPDQALRLFESMDPPLLPTLVLSHLREHAPQLQIIYLEQVTSQYPGSLSLDLQNELVQLYLTKVLQEREELEVQGKWNEKEHSEARQKLLAALDSSSFNAEHVLQRLPVDTLYEERAFLLGRMGQNHLALTLYVHKLHQPELALAYCDRVFLSSTLGAHKTAKASLSSLGPYLKDTAAANIYLTLLDVYLKPRSAIQEFDRSIASLGPTQGRPILKPSASPRLRGHSGRKIASIEDDFSPQKVRSADSLTESGCSEEELDLSEQQETTVGKEGVMLDEALDLLGQRWDRLDGAQALRMLPSTTKLQKLLPFLDHLQRKTSEAHRNAAIIKNLRQVENLQELTGKWWQFVTAVHGGVDGPSFVNNSHEVLETVMQSRKQRVKVTTDRVCSMCQKRIGSSVFAMYPSGTLVHFVCYRDRKGSRPLS